VFFLTTVFRVMPESGNNRRLSHAVATNHRPAKCLNFLCKSGFCC
jgi:hypothetical protein